MREQIIEKILNDKVIAIVRGIYDEDCLNLARALHEGGVNLLECTFDQKSHEERLRTVETVKLLVKELGDVMAFGTGTVTTVEMVNLAKEAGAQFIVSPDTCEEVIRATVAADMVSIPGALTPSEMANAHRYGADFIKVFPANLVGPAYFKTVAAPLSQIRMLAVGGVDASNIKDYVAAGAVGTGVAGCLFKKEWVKAGEWDKITEASKKFVSLL
ncbi:MAG: bifunctional 4-hydroxy-2-oxoglutarate aldolase/2-dehydro-3-deoxy-phosphogluconate aldolase [Clostridia bacterium]|nr:bifunctional 4-hydroxy-2-oxoglutarate aldolase/2-dehydro-3-deoxy-phosphogluconate aldolase [Clostridia bacterium]MBR6786537.1 bifunctional 4-hydroxy-2-oxoglutarate aldolase/2-dehydro-3-deoxy-phosphogluconate aldolase [Clostridia bacterium]